MDDISKIKVDIASLRQQLVELMKEGIKEIPFKDLILLIKYTSIVEEEGK